MSFSIEPAIGWRRARFQERSLRKWHISTTRRRPRAPSSVHRPARPNREPDVTPAPRPTVALPPLRDRAPLVATLVVILLTWAALAFACWRGREDEIDDWRFFLANLSEMAAQHADQTLAAADTV